jgi:DNA mismatch repair protein MutL
MSQQDLFPEQIELSSDELMLWTELKDDFAALGFDIRSTGAATVNLHGHPGELGNKNPCAVFQKLLDEYRHSGNELFASRRERLAAVLAQESAIQYNTHLTNEEMNHLAEKLFVCGAPNYSPTGKPVIHILNMEEIEKYF